MLYCFLLFVFVVLFFCCFFLFFVCLFFLEEGIKVTYVHKRCIKKKLQTEAVFIKKETKQ